MAEHKENPIVDHLSFCQAVLLHIGKTSEKGNLSNVISVIDDFCRQNPEYAINIGDSKGKILDTLISDCDPMNVLELGTFFGYGALRLAQMVKPGAKVYTIEINPAFATIAREVIDYCGMSDKIEVIVGKSSEIFPSLAKTTGVQSFDFVFIDHWKIEYKPDLMLLENFNLIKKGSVIVADNVIIPGAPDYLEYVRNNPKFECTNFPAKLNYRDRLDALEKSVFLG